MTNRDRTRWITIAVVVAVLAIIGAFAGNDDETTSADRSTTTRATATTIPPWVTTTTMPGPDTSADTAEPPGSGVPSMPAEPPGVDASTPPPVSVAPDGIVARTRAVLERVPVKGRAPKTGYDRGAFGPAWTDNVEVAGGDNGCDTRNDILRRDLTDPTTRPGTGGCIILTGVLVDPYTTKRIEFQRGQATSTAVQIDHVVALSDAWQTGAQQIGEPRRRAFANDPLNLLAVDGPTNQRKGDADAASWLPPNKAFRCRYVALQTHVKARYDLWMTRAEHDTIAFTLGGCTDAAVGAIG